MGLDQHAHLRNQKIDWEDYYMNDNSKSQEVFVWRKHARLQQFMAQKWDEQNEHHKHEGMLSHLGFNADSDTPVYITKEVAEDLADAIATGYKNYVAEDGFRREANGRIARTQRCRTCEFLKCEACDRQRQDSEGPVLLKDKEMNDEKSRDEGPWYRCQQA